jgi:hypothetical protein
MLFSHGHSFDGCYLVRTQLVRFTSFSGYIPKIIHPLARLGSRLVTPKLSATRSVQQRQRSGQPSSALVRAHSSSRALLLDDGVLLQETVISEVECGI